MIAARLQRIVCLIPRLRRGYATCLRFQRTACLASQSGYASELGSGIVDCRAAQEVNGIFSKVTLISVFHAMFRALRHSCDIFVLQQEPRFDPARFVIILRNSFTLHRFGSIPYLLPKGNSRWGAPESACHQTVLCLSTEGSQAE